jgi:hypothetical protein
MLANIIIFSKVNSPVIFPLLLQVKETKDMSLVFTWDNIQIYVGARRETSTNHPEMRKFGMVFATKNRVPFDPEAPYTPRKAADVPLSDILPSQETWDALIATQIHELERMLNRNLPWLTCAPNPDLEPPRYAEYLSLKSQHVLETYLFFLNSLCFGYRSMWVSMKSTHHPPQAQLPSYRKLLINARRMAPMLSSVMGSQWSACGRLEG